MAEDWQTQGFRQNVLSKINDAIQQSHMNPARNGTEMENHVFQKARSREEYLSFVAKLIIHVRGIDSKNKNAQPNSGDVQGGNAGGMPDPINALQNLASQGTRNPIQPQMMGMGGPINSIGPTGGGGVGGVPGGGGIQPGNNPNNSNVLQSLIHQRPGQQQMQAMQNMQGRVQGQPMVGNNPGAGGPGTGAGGNGPGNLQQGNLPPNSMGPNSIGMSGLNSMGNQVSNASVQMAGNMPIGPNLNQMTGQMQMNNMNMQNQQMNPMNNMVPMNMNPQLNQNQLNQMNMNNQMNQNQMSQLLNRINVGPGGPGGPGGGMNQTIGMVGNQMSQMNQGGMGQVNPNVNVGGMSGGPQQMGGNVQGMGPINPNNMGPNQMNPGAGGMNLNQMLSMQQMGRKPNQDLIMNNSPNMYQAVRNVAPAAYFRKSPSPSAPSPATLAASHQGQQMVPSPALVPSPQMPNMITPQRSVMAPSPSASINTPGQVVAAPSPLNPQEEQLYREKYRQLTKYIEPLKRMVAKIGNDDEKVKKMNKLLEILSNPNRRIPLETLLKCEIALEKMDFKSNLFQSTGPQFGSLKENSLNNPLLEAVNATLQSPIGNHTLQRTFRPCLEALFGPDIKNLPPPAKLQKLSADISLSTAISQSTSMTTLDIPHLLQGEIARLDQKFKISLDPSSQNGSNIIKLICCLDDKYLPCVPPVSIVIPDDYPTTAPCCSLIQQEYDATPFLIAVQKAFTARISKLPKQFSLSHLLDTWEMAVRQACSPAITNPTKTTVLLGI